MNIFKRIIRIFCYIASVGAFTLLILTGFHNDNLETLSYSYNTNKLNEPFKALLISDLHHRESLNFPNTNLISEIQKENPNAVFLCGDFVDNWSRDLTCVKSLFEGLKDIQTFYITGNHEHEAPLFKDLIDEIKKYNYIQYIDDMKVDIKDCNVTIYGIHDNSFSGETRTETGKTYKTLEEQLEEFKEGIDTNRFNILLAHSPNYVNLYKKYGFDAIMCGHTHGGQFRIGNWSPFTLFHGLNSYNAGEYKIDNNDNQRVYVSKGLGYSGVFPIRVNCNPDYISVTFSKGNQ